MNSLVHARVKQYLQHRLRCEPHACGAVLFNMQKVARVAGYDLDQRFARAGLGAGPEAEVASGIVDRALGGGGNAVTEHVLKQTLDRWTRTTSGMGM